MKLMKRTEIYKASNVMFDPQSMTATSYDWWYFVRRIKGQVVFNQYRYSLSTGKHQSKVRNLLSDLGIKVDRTVSIRSSLSEFDSLKALNDAVKEQARIDAEDAEARRIERNLEARHRKAAAKLTAYLENEVAFRDYEILQARQFGKTHRQGVHQVVDMKSMEHDVQNALHSFHRDGFSSVVFYV